jgi:alkylation response protein AidB-like acyl-CoA dehydrogenase
MANEVSNAREGAAHDPRTYALRLTLDEEQRMFASTARKLVAEASPVARLRTLRDSNDAVGYSRELWAQMAELGFLGLGLPEAHGGAGGFFELAIVLEELGRSLAPEPMISTVLLGARTLLLGENAAQAERLLPRIVAGEAVVTLAFEERGMRFEYARPRATATPLDANGDFRLDGEKAQVLDGHVADALLVTTTSEDGLRIFVVDPKAEGVRIARQQRLDGRNAAIVALDGVRATAGDVIASPSHAEQLLADVLDRASIGVAAEMLGGAEQALADTVEYLKQRVQFGVPIGSFQALQHRAARLFTEVQLLRASVLAAARAVDDAPSLVPSLASLAKARAADTFTHVAKEAIQMHGGIGMTDEHDIGFYFKRAQAAAYAFGDAAHHRARWATLHGY